VTASSLPPVSPYRIRRRSRKSPRWARPCSTRAPALTGTRPNAHRRLRDFLHPEVGWNENSSTGIAASPGGVSIFYPKPIWQNGPGVPADNARDLPISPCPRAAMPLIASISMDSITSLAALPREPRLRRNRALLNHYQVKNGLQSAPGMGNINPELYRLAKLSGRLSRRHRGDNYVPCVQSSPGCLTGSFGYTAGPVMTW